MTHPKRSLALLIREPGGSDKPTRWEYTAKQTLQIDVWAGVASETRDGLSTDDAKMWLQNLRVS